MSKLTSLAKFWRLAPSERGLFLRAMLLLAVTGFSLRLVSFRLIQGLLSPVNVAVGKAHSPVKDAAQARQTARIVAAAARHGPYRANCLPTSLVLRYLLLRQGIQADLRVGVRRADCGGLDAHAWVEHADQPLIDRSGIQQRFAPFDQPIRPSGEAPG